MGLPLSAALRRLKLGQSWVLILLKSLKTLSQRRHTMQVAPPKGVPSGTPFLMAAPRLPQNKARSSLGSTLRTKTTQRPSTPLRGCYNRPISRIDAALRLLAPGPIPPLSSALPAPTWI